MASIEVSSFEFELDLGDSLTFGLEACVREIVRFGPSFTNLQLGFRKVLSFFILLLRT